MTREESRSNAPGSTAFAATANAGLISHDDVRDMHRLACRNNEELIAARIEFQIRGAFRNHTVGGCREKRFHVAATFQDNRYTVAVSLDGNPIFSHPVYAGMIPGEIIEPLTRAIDGADPALARELQENGNFLYAMEQLRDMKTITIPELPAEFQVCAPARVQDYATPA